MECSATLQPNSNSKKSMPGLPATSGTTASPKIEYVSTSAFRLNGLVLNPSKDCCSMNVGVSISDLISKYSKPNTNPIGPGSPGRENQSPVFPETVPMITFCSLFVTDLPAPSGYVMKAAASAPISSDHRFNGTHPLD